MAVFIGSNVASLKAQRALSENVGRLGKISTQLSSGLRINKASDDAAALFLSEDLNTSSKVYGQAIRNVNDAISFLAIEEGALDSLSTVLIRQRELATQASSGVFSSSQRRALTSEYNALTDEYNRIVESLEMNGRKILQNPGESLTIQAGFGSDGSLSMTLADQLGVLTADGTFAAQTTSSMYGGPGGIALADFNNDGIMDMTLLK